MEYPRYGWLADLVGDKHDMYFYVLCMYVLCVYVELSQTTPPTAIT